MLKLNEKFNKILAITLAMIILLSSLPANVFALSSVSNTTNGDVTINSTQDANDKNLYTIDVNYTPKAQATVKDYVVYVLPGQKNTGPLIFEDVKKSIPNLNPDTQIAFVYYNNSTTAVSTQFMTRDQAKNVIYSGGNTTQGVTSYNLGAGFTKVNELISNITDGNISVATVLVGHNSNSTVVNTIKSQASLIKQKAKIVTGMVFNTNINDQYYDKNISASDMYVSDEYQRMASNDTYSGVGALLDGMLKNTTNKAGSEKNAMINIPLSPELSLVSGSNNDTLNSTKTSYSFKVRFNDNVKAGTYQLSTSPTVSFDGGATTEALQNLSLTKEETVAPTPDPKPDPTPTPSPGEIPSGDMENHPDQQAIAKRTFEEYIQTYKDKVSTSPTSQTEIHRNDVGAITLGSREIVEYKGAGIYTIRLNVTTAGFGTHQIGITEVVNKEFEIIPNTVSAIRGNGTPISGVTSNNSTIVMPVTKFNTYEKFYVQYDVKFKDDVEKIWKIYELADLTKTRVEINKLTTDLSGTKKNDFNQVTMRWPVTDVTIKIDPALIPAEGLNFDIKDEAGNIVKSTKLTTGQTTISNLDQFPKNGDKNSKQINYTLSSAYDHLFVKTEEIMHPGGRRELIYTLSPKATTEFNVSVKNKTNPTEISNVEFNLKRNGTQNIKNTEVNGILKYSGVYTGEYTLEMKTPAGYVSDNTVWTVKINNQGNVSYKDSKATTFTDLPIGESIVGTIYKAESNFNITVLENTYKDTKLQGVKLRLVNKANSSDVREVTTDVEGKVSLPDIATGEYTLSVVSAPATHEVTKNTWTVTVSNDNIITTKLDDPSSQPTSSPYNHDLQIRLNPKIKGASVTVKVTNNKTPETNIEDAIFVLKNSNGNIVQSATSDANGVVTFKDIVPSATKYTIENTSAPNGYEVSTVIYDVLVGQDNKVGVKLKDETSYRTAVENPTVRYSLIEKLIDESLGRFKVQLSDSRGNPDKKSGVSFTLTKSPKDGSPAQTLKTDANGQIDFTNLQQGDYDLTISNLPTGWMAVNSVINIKVDANGQVSYKPANQNQYTPYTENPTINISISQDGNQGESNYQSIFGLDGFNGKTSLKIKAGYEPSITKQIRPTKKSWTVEVERTGDRFDTLNLVLATMQNAGISNPIVTSINDSSGKSIDYTQTFDNATNSAIINFKDEDVSVSGKYTIEVLADVDPTRGGVLDDYVLNAYMASTVYRNGKLYGVSTTKQAFYPIGEYVGDAGYQRLSTADTVEIISGKYNNDKSITWTSTYANTEDAQIRFEKGTNNSKEVINTDKSVDFTPDFTLGAGQQAVSESVKVTLYRPTNDGYVIASETTIQRGQSFNIHKDWVASFNFDTTVTDGKVVQTIPGAELDSLYDDLEINKTWENVPSGVKVPDITFDITDLSENTPLRTGLVLASGQNKIVLQNISKYTTAKDGYDTPKAKNYSVRENIPEGTNFVLSSSSGDVITLTYNFSNRYSQSYTQGYGVYDVDLYDFNEVKLNTPEVGGWTNNYKHYSAMDLKWRIPAGTEKGDYFTLEIPEEVSINAPFISSEASKKKSYANPGDTTPYPNEPIFGTIKNDKGEVILYVYHTKNEYGKEILKFVATDKAKSQEGYEGTLHIGDRLSNSTIETVNGKAPNPNGKYEMGISLDRNKFFDASVAKPSGNTWTPRTTTVNKNLEYKSDFVKNDRVVSTNILDDPTSAIFSDRFQNENVRTIDKYQYEEDDNYIYWYIVANANGKYNMNNAVITEQPSVLGAIPNIVQSVDIVSVETFVADPIYYTGGFNESTMQRVDGKTTPSVTTTYSATNDRGRPNIVTMRTGSNFGNRTLIARVKTLKLKDALGNPINAGGLYTNSVRIEGNSSTQGWESYAMQQYTTGYYSTHTVGVVSEQVRPANYGFEFTKVGRENINGTEVFNPLPGAVFELSPVIADSSTSSPSKATETATSDATGKVKFKYPNPGYYTIKEVKSPDGYKNSKTPIYVKVDYLGNIHMSTQLAEITKKPVYDSTPKVKIADYYYYGNLFINSNTALNSFDEFTGEYKQTININPYKIDYGGDGVYMVFDKEPLNVKANLPYKIIQYQGKYTLFFRPIGKQTVNVEITDRVIRGKSGDTQFHTNNVRLIPTDSATPETAMAYWDYETGRETFYVDIQETISMDMSNTKPFSYTNEKVDKNQADILIKKTDETANKNPLKGAIFSIYELTYVEDTTGTYKKDASGNYIKIASGETYTGTKYREIETQLEQVAGKPWLAASDINGVVKFADLQEGLYRVKELRAPDGYDKTNQVWNFEVTPQGLVLEVKGKETQTGAIPDQGKHNQGGHYYNNQPIKGPLYVGAKIISADEKTFTQRIYVNGYVYGDPTENNEGYNFEASDNPRVNIKLPTNGTYIYKMASVEATDNNILNNTFANSFKEAYATEANGKIETFQYTGENLSINLGNRLFNPNAPRKSKLGKGVIIEITGPHGIGANDLSKVINTQTSFTAGYTYNQPLLNGLTEQTYFSGDANTPAQVSNQYTLGNITYDESTPVKKPIAAGEYVGVINEPKTQFGSVSIHKVDSAEKRPLQGAKFGIFTAASDGKLTPVFRNGVPLEVVSGADGYARFTQLPYGEYIIKEIQAPTGYVLDSKQRKVIVGDPSSDKITIEANQKATTVGGVNIASKIVEIQPSGVSGSSSGTFRELIYINSNGAYLTGGSNPSKLTISPYASGDTGKLNTSAKNIQNVKVYRVDRNSGSMPSNFNLDLSKLPTADSMGFGDYVRYTVNNDGQIVFDRLSYLMNQGQGLILEVTGTYDGKDGKPLTTSVDFSINAQNGSLVNQNKLGSTLINHNLEIENIKMGEIEITKIDSTDGTRVLKGAQFTILKKGSNTPIQKDGKDWIVESGVDGKVVFSGLEEGTYIIREIKAPAGYTIGPDREVTLSNNKSNVNSNATSTDTVKYQDVGITQIASKIMSVDSNTNTFKQLIYVNAWNLRNPNMPVNFRNIPSRLWINPNNGIQGTSAVTDITSVKMYQVSPNNTTMPADFNLDTSKLTQYTGVDSNFTKLNNGDYYSSNLSNLMTNAEGIVLEVTGKYNPNSTEPIVTRTYFDYLPYKTNYGSVVSESEIPKQTQTPSSEGLNAKIDFPNEPDISGKGEFKLIKTDEKGQNLNGAEFELFKGDLKNNRPDSSVTPYRNGISAKDGTTDGIIKFKDLAAGTYTLFEKKAPNGYKISGNSWKVVVHESGYTTVQLNPLKEETSPTSKDVGAYLKQDSYSLLHADRPESDVIYINKNAEMLNFKMGLIFDTKMLAQKNILVNPGDYFTLSLDQKSWPQGISHKLEPKDLVDGNGVVIARATYDEVNKKIKFTFTDAIVGFDLETTKLMYETAMAIDRNVVKGIETIRPGDAPTTAGSAQNQTREATPISFVNSIENGITLQAKSTDVQSFYIDYRISDIPSNDSTEGIWYVDYPNDYQVNGTSTIVKHNSETQEVEILYYVNPARRRMTQESYLSIMNPSGSRNMLINTAKVEMYEYTGTATLPKSFGIENTQLTKVTPQIQKAYNDAKGNQLNVTIPKNGLSNGNAYVVKVTAKYLKPDQEIRFRAEAYESYTYQYQDLDGYYRTEKDYTRVYAINNLFYKRSSSGTSEAVIKLSEVRISNQKLEFPATGGRGVQIFYMLGLFVMGISSLIYVKKREKYVDVVRYKN